MPFYIMWLFIEGKVRKMGERRACRRMSHSILHLILRSQTCLEQIRLENFCKWNKYYPIMQVLSVFLWPSNIWTIYSLKKIVFFVVILIGRQIVLRKLVSNVSGALVLKDTLYANIQKVVLVSTKKEFSLLPISQTL